MNLGITRLIRTGNLFCRTGIRIERTGIRIGRTGISAENGDFEWQAGIESMQQEFQTGVVTSKNLVLNPLRVRISLVGIDESCSSLFLNRPIAHYEFLNES
jgi:hypothetical protein